MFIILIFYLLNDNKFFVKRWHHTNSIAIISYIFNTSSNSQSAHDQSADVKSTHR